MAGISVTLEGNSIQLSFEKNDQTTAVVMDAGTAQSLVLALGQLLLKIDAEEEIEDGDAFSDEEFLDVTSPTIDVGTDERGQAVVALQAGPFVLRLNDDEARHVAQGLMEILNAPRDIRTSHGDH